MEHGIGEFAKLAQEEFGDKVIYCAIEPKQDKIDEMNKQYESHVTIDDFLHYGKHVWLVEPKCPKCDYPLLGVFGSFAWGLVHGEGGCSECGEINLRLYHYIGNSKRPIEAFEMIGF